jgi:hypothetical protein
MVFKHWIHLKNNNKKKVIKFLKKKCKTKRSRLPFPKVSGLEICGKDERSSQGWAIPPLEII